MEVVEHELVHLTDNRAVKLVSVQLVSPFTTGEMEPHQYHEWISWKTGEAEAGRRQKVEAILETLRARDHDILVFPEYSVPESLHLQPVFQQHADTKACIVIPGSFCPTSSNSPFHEYHRSNLCRIYLPYQQPLLIAKKELHPSEEKFVDSSSGLPNSARLLWNTADGRQASINIFICRDYLKPFRQAADAPSPRMVSQLDWEREGLNIVIMESKEPNVFLGRAAAEIRRLRGPGKVVLFANSAMNGGELATALIGPSPVRRMEFGDVVECVPADKEGILSSDISLSNVELTETRPDKTIKSPIGNTKIDLLSTGIANSIQLRPLPKHGPTLRRGVWHPALLAALDKRIVIDFYQTQNLRPIREGFKNRISSVYAALIRGLDDVMVRRYDREITFHLAYPFSNLTSGEQKIVFGKHAAFISAQPDGILKYRGHKFDGSSWDSERSKLDRLLSDERTRDARINAIAALAEDWDSLQIGEDIRHEISSAFDNRIENTIPLDQDVQNGIFETYVLIGIAPQHDQNVYTELLLNRVLDDDNVREVFHPISTSMAFQYLLKLKCTQGKTDEIVLRIRDEAEQRGFLIGTRTFSVMAYLQKESVIGLADANIRPEVKLFFEALRSTDGEASRSLNLKPKTEQFLELASLYARQRNSALYLGQNFLNNLAGFYSHLYIGNFIHTEPSFRDGSLEHAHNSYSNMFKVSEREAEHKISAVLAVTGHSAIADTVKQRYPKAYEERGRNDPLELMLKLPQLFTGDALDEQFRKARSLRQLAGNLRNLASHGSLEQYAPLDISSDDWQRTWKNIVMSTSALLEMIAIVHAAKTA